MDRWYREDHLAYANHLADYKPQLPGVPSIHPRHVHCAIAHNAPIHAGDGIDQPGYAGRNQHADKW